MKQEDITEIYETLAPMAGDYMNAQAEQIGAAQQSMGPLAANTMGATTSGLGNYTYNRLMRPQVDVMRDQILVQGYANQLNRALSDRLNAARNKYNKRVGGTTSGNDDDTTTNTGVTKIGGTKDVTVPAGGNSNTGVAGVSTLPSTAKEGEYNVGTATVNGETRIVTKEKNGNYHVQGVGSYRPGSQIWEDVKKKWNIKLNDYPGSSIWTTF